MDINMIEIDVNFKNSENLLISNQATYFIEFKNSGIFKCQLLFIPLKDDSFRNNHHFSIGSIPTLAYNQKVAEMTVKSN
jgi:hypothetical protein